MEESKAIVLSYETGLVPASKKQVVMAVVKQYLDEFDKELPERISESASLKIKNQEDREFATIKRQEAAAALDDIAEKRKSFLGPPKKDIVEIEAMFNKIQKQITTIKENYNSEIGRYFMEQKRITAEAEAKLREESEKQRLQAQEAIISQAIDQNDEKLLAEADNVFVPDIKLAEPERSTKTDFGSTNVRTEFAVEVTDKMALIRHVAQANLFSGYLEVDLAYAKRDINKNNWKDIPGLKITEVPKVSGRSK
jgi:phage gp36-like protein